ncbi:SDR family NAD(P)-dependent oxidoreductase [Alicyclobacillus sp. TC]|uniref:SDR family NAD(P)-dependent oxidoreductase n=1 Tax=Alicyclobacillus sp. TC TaxID=2606450 RepID=UPI002106A72A|nr:SDR family NAD(P)-dependent oxidoreductase [Alicyclobacillus sp. TC]
MSSSWDQLLKGKVAIVTGASRGLGRQDALALAEAGADVVVTDILVEGDATSKERAMQMGPLAQVMESTQTVFTKQTAREIESMGRRAIVAKMDVTNRNEVRDVIDKVYREMGRIDILVNNAGTLDHVSQIENQRDEWWERDLRVNLTGAYNCTKAVWSIMKEQGSGTIINMASVAGTLGDLVKLVMQRQREVC